MSEKEIQQLEDRYQELSEKFDPYYQYLNDPEKYQKHHTISMELKSIENKLKSIN